MQKDVAANDADDGHQWDDVGDEAKLDGLGDGNFESGVAEEVVADSAYPTHTLSQL